jgi:hypothetical protein
VTILPEILPSPNLAVRLLQVCSERGWNKLGLLDFEGFPWDVHAALREAVECVDVPWAAVRPAPDRWELAMHDRAWDMARAGLTAELPSAVGLTDHEFTGRLERRLRRDGAEDLIVLLTNGDGPPVPAHGETLRDGFSVSVALEYRGHWAKVVQTQGAEGGVQRHVRVENLSGALPYIDDPDPAPSQVVVQTFETERDGRREFHDGASPQTGRGSESR